MDSSPRLIYLLSGKRKCGKDYVAALLQKRLGDVCVTIRLSAPIKLAFAEQHGLDYHQLLSDSDYKERYRQEMIVWGEQRRREDPGCFCRLAVQMALRSSVAGSQDQFDAWIVSDVRRRSDIRWFRDNFGDRVRTVKITASDQSRAQRGFIFTKGVDDAESECDLDSITDWNLCIRNENKSSSSRGVGCDRIGVGGLSSALFDDQYSTVETALIVMHSWLHN